jgi:hypothetical protein
MHVSPKEYPIGFQIGPVSLMAARPMVGESILYRDYKSNPGNQKFADLPYRLTSFSPPTSIIPTLPPAYLAE